MNPTCENCGHNPCRQGDIDYRRSKEARGEHDPYMVVCEDCDKTLHGRRPARKKSQAPAVTDRTNYRNGNALAEQRRRYFMILFDIDRALFASRYNTDPESNGGVSSGRTPLVWLSRLPAQAQMDISNRSIQIRSEAYPKFYTDEEPRAVSEALFSLRQLLGTYQLMGTIPFSGVASKDKACA